MCRFMKASRMERPMKQRCVRSLDAGPPVTRVTTYETGEPYQNSPVPPIPERRIAERLPERREALNPLHLPAVGANASTPIYPHRRTEFNR
jgi:hypothetical protein